MTSKDLLADIQEHTDMSRSQVNKLMEAFVVSVTNALIENKVVHIQDFGDWEVKTRMPRQAVHPRTGEVILTQEKQQVVFKQNVALKKLLSNE